MHTGVAQPVVRNLGKLKDRRVGGLVSDMLDGFEMSSNNIHDQVKQIWHMQTLIEIARREKKA